MALDPRGALVLFSGGQDSTACGNCDTCTAPPQTWDGTVPAQKLLSAVVRLDQRRQRYGAGHVIDILLGNETPRVRQLDHTTLTVFGVGADLTEGQWRGVVRQLLAQRLLAVGTDGYGTLEVTEGSAEVLRGNRTVALRRAGLAGQSRVSWGRLQGREQRSRPRRCVG